LAKKVKPGAGDEVEEDAPAISTYAPGGDHVVQ
jgi:hypothetical protein